VSSTKFNGLLVTPTFWRVWNLGEIRLNERRNRMNPPDSRSILLSQESQVTPQYEQGAASSPLNPRSHQIVLGRGSHPSATQMMHIARAMASTWWACAGNLVSPGGLRQGKVKPILSSSTNDFLSTLIECQRAVAAG
jgi:hypothetical protein